MTPDRIDQAIHEALLSLGRGGFPAPWGDATELEKAVAPHPSHVQSRGRRGRFERGYGGTPRGSRPPRGETAGYLHLAADVIEHEFGPRLHTHLGDLLDAKITSEQCSERAAAEICHFYEVSFRYGRAVAGDVNADLRPGDRALLNRMVKDEQDYLRAFMDDVKEGRGVWDYRRRMEAYVGAAWEAYWAGWALGDVRAGREVRWFLGQTNEHCTDCQRFSDIGWMPIARFLSEVVRHGYLPRSGHLECLGIHCRCFLRERTAPRRVPPKGRPAAGKPAGPPPPAPAATAPVPGAPLPPKGAPAPPVLPAIPGPAAPPLPPGGAPAPPGPPVAPAPGRAPRAGLVAAAGALFLVGLLRRTQVEVDGYTVALAGAWRKDDETWVEPLPVAQAAGVVLGPPLPGGTVTLSRQGIRTYAPVRLRGGRVLVALSAFGQLPGLRVGWEETRSVATLKTRL